MIKRTLFFFWNCTKVCVVSPICLVLGCASFDSVKHKFIPYKDGDASQFWVCSDCYASWEEGKKHEASAMEELDACVAYLNESYTYRPRIHKENKIYHCMGLKGWVLVEGSVEVIRD